MLKRTEQLARRLNQYLRAMSFSILHCASYMISKYKFTGSRFHLPQDIKPDQRPKTLRKLIDFSGEVPGLEEKFDLAETLVKTVYEMHAIGWVHGNLLSDRIFSWPRRNEPTRHDIGKLYLPDFDIASPSQPGEYLEPPQELYNLGLLMFEIGFWRLRATFTAQEPHRPLHPSFPADTIRAHKFILRQYMGGRYTESAVACLIRAWSGIGKLMECLGK